MQLVAGFVANPSHAPQWYCDIESVQWKTEPPVRVGSRLAFAVKFRGRTRVYTYEVTEAEPGERPVTPTAEGPFRMETTYTWMSAGTDATRMTLRNRGEPAGFCAVVAPVMASAIRRANRADPAQLKSLLAPLAPSPLRSAVALASLAGRETRRGLAERLADDNGRREEGAELGMNAGAPRSGCPRCRGRDAGDHSKKWVRGRGSRTSSTSTSIFSL